GQCMKWGGRVILVFMVYSEYEKIKSSDNWPRQLGSSGSGVIGAVGGGAAGGAAVGAVLGGLEVNPFTVAAGSLLGGMIGGWIGYKLCSGGYEHLWDVLYSD